MHLRIFHILSALLCAALACQSGATRAFVSVDTGDSVVATVGPAGGVLQALQDGVEYTLEIPEGALLEDTEVSMTPARFRGVEGSIGARFSPEGLRFEAPAALRISQAPTGELLLAVQDGQFPVEAEFAISTPDAVLLPITHFSTHVAATVDSVLAGLPADVRARAEAVRDLGPDAVAAIGLGEFYRGHVEPLLPLSARDVHGFELATRAVVAWLNLGQDLPAAFELPHEIGGTETLGVLSLSTTTDLGAAGRELLPRLTRPACTGTSDISSAVDWVRLPGLLTSLLSLLGEPAEPGELCAVARTRIEGPSTMDATTSAIHLALFFEVVADDGGVAATDALFFIESFGVTGPTEVEEDNGGTVRDLAFERALGSDRARAITIIVRGASPAGQLGVLGEAPPAIFELTEEGTALTLSTNPAQLDSASETAQVCASVLVDGQPLQAFSVDFTTQGPGNLDVVGVVTTDGQACATYTPPSPLPASGGDVSFAAVADAAGGQLRKSTSLHLGEGSLQLALSANPGAATSAGEQIEVCATLSSDGTPVADYLLQFSLAGEGQLAVTDPISVVGSSGTSCTSYTAPTPLTIGQSATVSAHASVGPLGADATREIIFSDFIPLVSLSATAVADASACDGVPIQNIAVAVVAHPTTFAPLAGVEVSFEIDGTAIGVSTTEADGSATSPEFPAPAGSHTITATVAGALASTPYNNFEDSHCGACEPVACGRVAGSPGITICPPNDAACAAAARCACDLEGCRNDGPFNNMDETGFIVISLQYHCREN